VKRSFGYGILAEHETEADTYILKFPTGTGMILKPCGRNRYFAVTYESIYRQIRGREVRVNYKLRLTCNGQPSISFPLS
jgi:hypothetical protein